MSAERWPAPGTRFGVLLDHDGRAVMGRSPIEDDVVWVEIITKLGDTHGRLYVRVLNLKSTAIFREVGYA